MVAVLTVGQWTIGKGTAQGHWLASSVEELGTGRVSAGLPGVVDRRGEGGAGEGNNKGVIWQGKISSKRGYGYNQQQGSYGEGRGDQGEDEGWWGSDRLGPLAFMARRFGEEIGPEVFLLDCAATSHMVDGSVILEEEVAVNTEIKGVANVMATAKGVLKVGGMIFKDVLKVPGLGVNLISEGALHAKGCDIVSCAREGWRRVFLREKLVIEANYEKGLFVWRPPVTFLNKDPNYPVCLLASGEGTGEQQLWHLRMGHLNYTDMDKLKYMSLNMEYAKGAQHGMCGLLPGEDAF